MSRFDIGSVSYLNAKPLIDGLAGSNGLTVRTAVPSRLLDPLLADEVHLSLCPVIDYQTSPEALEIVPVGAIGSRGETMTVRVFSRVPLEDAARIHVDTDSHTSVALLRIILAHHAHGTPELVPRTVNGDDPEADPSPEALLLIGDKVVTREPEAEHYRYQLDLGTAWYELTGLPFVFATWMTKPGRELGELPQILDRARRRNQERIAEIATCEAPAAGWPVELAARYLGSLLRYELGPQEIDGMLLFWEHCKLLGIVGELRPLRLRRTEF